MVAEASERERKPWSGERARPKNKPVLENLLIYGAVRGKRCSTKMGLEKRGNRLYFYRKERDGDRVRSVYVASGQMAQQYSVLALAAKVEAIEQRAAKDAERERNSSLDRAIAQNDEITGAVATSILLLNGYHLHSRTWRRKRKTNAED